MIRTSRGTALEAAVILALTLAGAVVRLLGSDRLGLSHFDEGIYAMSGFWVVAPEGLAAIPTRLIPFAPPGFPILIGLSYFVFGIGDEAAIVVGQVAGIATIPVVGWIGRRTFGPGAGAASSALAAFCPAHVVFSRMALTDAPYLLAWLVAIGLGARFLERPRFGRAVLFGAAVGLAQQIKYNGWLAFVVVALAAAIRLVRCREGRDREVWKTVGYGCCALLVGFLLVLPWVRFVEEHFGYRRLTEHHRGYFDGLWAWPRNCSSQMDQAVTLSGGPAWGGGAASLAFLGAALTLPASPFGMRIPFRSKLILLVVGIGLAAALAALPNLPWWVGLGMTPWLLVDPAPSRRIVGAWWLLLSILTPFYHPYARLWLPLDAAGWLVLGGGIARALAEFASVPTTGAKAVPDPWRSTVSLACAIAMIGFGPLSFSARPKSDLLGPTDTLAVVAGSLVPDLGEGPSLRLLASPALEYELRLRGVSVAVEPDVDHLLKPDGRWALVDEIILRQSPEPDRARLFASHEVVREVPYPLGLVAALDVDPGLAVRNTPTLTSHVWLLRPRVLR